MITKSYLSKPLKGNANTVSDKSISHRAIILSSLAQGNSSIYNLLLSEDIKATLDWAKNIGVKYKYNNNKLDIDTSLVKINNKNLKKNNHKNFDNENIYKFYVNNSGTSARLLMGVMSGVGSISLFYGDRSLQKRPMLRVLKPLVNMGSRIYALTDLGKQKFTINNINNYQNSFTDIINNDLKLITACEKSEVFLPVIIKGGYLRGIDFTLKIASAQVKSSLLLASLFAEGDTLITEPILTRDHTENMLIAAGVNLKVSKNHLGNKTIFMPQNNNTLNPCNWCIPGDFSSAAFIIVASLIIPHSHVLLKGINLNPLRTGLLQVLKNIGANIKVYYKDKLCGEDYGDIQVKYTKNLLPIKVTQYMVPSMIDEFPILFCLASIIKGESKFLGIEELRYKESDRILSMERVLNSLGIDTINTFDSLTIYGNDQIIENAPHIEVDPNLDHRVAMSCLILGLVMRNGMIVKSTETIKTSFPDFTNVFQSLGANISSYS